MTIIEKLAWIIAIIFLTSMATLSIVDTFIVNIPVIQSDGVSVIIEIFLVVYEICMFLRRLAQTQS